MITAFMRTIFYRLFGRALLSALLVLSAGCSNQDASPQPDHPRLPPNVTLRDITFRSAALSRDMQYRVVLPSRLMPGQKLQVVYLLHGGGGGFRDWTNDSDVAGFAALAASRHARRRFFVLHECRRPPQDRYEDYIVQDLISDVEGRFPAASGRSNRAIVGISMGGFGAVKLALHHPDLFIFAGGISSAIDVPRRAFSLKRLQQSRHYHAIFGPSGSQTRRNNDPFVLGSQANAEATPYFF